MLVYASTPTTPPLVPSPGVLPAATGIPGIPVNIDAYELLVHFVSKYRPYRILPFSIAARYSGRAGADFKSHPDDVRHEGSRRARTGSRTPPRGFLSCSVGPAGIGSGERGGGAKGGAEYKEALFSEQIIRG